MKKLIALILISLVIPIPSASANDKLAIVKETSVVTGSTSVTSNIWKGNIPTRVGIRQYSNYLVEFPIQGLLAYETLGAKNSRGTGVTVEFEIWSSGGKKLGYDTIYSSSWNPVGPNTSVEFYLFDYPIGTHTLIIRTKYELSTTGLLTTYWEGKIQQAITVYDIDAQARIDAEALAKAKAEAEAKVIAEAKAKAESEAKAKAEAELKAKQEAEAKIKAEADAKAKAEADAKAKLEAEAQAITWTCREDLRQYYSKTYNKDIALMNKYDSTIFCNNLLVEINAKAYAEANAKAMQEKRDLVNGTACKKLGSTKLAGGQKFTCKKINKKLIWKM
jgi:hypothetical protein